MSLVLIPTFVEDIHAYAAAIVLERMGHRAVLWHCSDLPEHESASIAFEPGGPSTMCLHGRDADIALDRVDAFWNRRVGPPVVTTDLVACDRDIVVNESQRLVRSLLVQLSQGRFAVNGFHAARNAEDKVLQLAMARQAGFELPATLVSGDPASIRRFVARHEATGAVVKNFSPMGWQGDRTMCVNFTARIDGGLLPRDGMLRLTPSIYQADVPKAYEVRVTCMGAEMVAAALHSQRQETSRTDWRTVKPESLDIQRIVLPRDVALRCAALMSTLDLRFGCFDFIVTPDGRWVFLELNQMGQFLWVEESHGDLPLLQMFCDFLVAGDPAFRYARRRGEIAFEEVVAEACGRMEAAALRHLQPERPPHIHVEAPAPTRLAA